MASPRRARGSAAGLALLGALALWPLAAAADAPCAIGYQLGFFNGVDNTFVDALESLAALRDAVHEANGSQADVFDDEGITYHAYYNTTGSTVGSSMLQDVAETFIQRAREIDPSGAFANNYLYLMWEGNGSGSGAGYAPAASSYPPASNLLQVYQNSIVTMTVAKLAAFFNTPPTQVDLAQQQADLTAAAAAGRKLVLVAHSQGNLFVNQAYQFIQPVVGSDRVSVVHVAPASPTLSGPYLLANIDLIINALRLVNGFNTVPPVNLTMTYDPLTDGDPAGHGLVPVYLDPNRPGRAATQQLLIGAFTSLEASSCTLTLSPSPAHVPPGLDVTLAAANAIPADVDAVVTYDWVITGAAGGSFVNPLLQTSVQKLTTTQPTVTYHAAADAPLLAKDTVSITANLSNVNTPADSKAIGTSSASVVIEAVAVTITPSNPTLAAGVSRTFGLTVEGTLPPDAGYRWALSGTGALASPTTGATVTYTAPASGTDTLSISVLNASGTVLATDATTITIKPPSGLTFVASTGSACCGGLAPGTYATATVPTGAYGTFGGNYNGDPVYGFVVSWPVQSSAGGTFGVTLRPGGQHHRARHLGHLDQHPQHRGPRAVPVHRRHLGQPGAGDAAHPRPGGGRRSPGDVHLHRGQQQRLLDPHLRGLGLLRHPRTLSGAGPAGQGATAGATTGAAWDPWNR
jgi:hypothetical protein